jgi:uroporphyrinogen-III synthase
MARVLVSLERAEPLSTLLRARGLDPVHLPLQVLRATGQPPPAEAARWVLLSSAATLRFQPDLARHIAGRPVVAVGPATARAAAAAGLDCALVGEGGGAEALQALLLQAPDPEGGPLWHVGAAQPAPALAAALSAWPGPVLRWAVYESAVPQGLEGSLAALGPLDGLCFASGRAAAAFAAHRAQGSARVAVIGPRTAVEAQAAGLSVHAIARKPSLGALADATAALFEAGPLDPVFSGQGPG